MMNLRLVLQYSALIALTSCGGGESAVAPAWLQASSRTTCEALNPTACNGFYGFVAQASGHYVAGPNALGRTVEGELNAAERDLLDIVVGAVAAAFAKNPVAQCQGIVSIPGVSDTVKLSIAGSPLELVLQDATRVCSYNGDTASTTALVKTIDQLRLKYYPPGF